MKEKRRERSWKRGGPAVLQRGRNRERVPLDERWGSPREPPKGEKFFKKVLSINPRNERVCPTSRVTIAPKDILIKKEGKLYRKLRKQPGRKKAKSEPEKNATQN